jgi:hypothetical protein
MAETIEAYADVQPEIERNYRWNFVVNALDGATYWFGFSFITPTIILPSAISHFTNNPLIIGLILFINTAGFSYRSFHIQLRQRAPKDVFPVNLGFFTERVPVFFWRPALISCHRSACPGVGHVLSVVHLVLWGCRLDHRRLAGYGCENHALRQSGRFFGITNFLGNGSGILGRWQ